MSIIDKLEMEILQCDPTHVHYMYLPDRRDDGAIATTSGLTNLTVRVGRHHLKIDRNFTKWHTNATHRRLNTRLKNNPTAIKYLDDMIRIKTL